MGFGAFGGGKHLSGSVLGNEYHFLKLRSRRSTERFDLVELHLVQVAIGEEELRVLDLRVCVWS